MTQAAVTRAIDFDDLHTRQQEFRDSLFEAGILVPTGAEGIYGHGTVFTELTAAIDARIGLAVRDVHAGAARTLRFPPVMPLEILDRTDYIASFPHLAATVAVYSGGEAEHRLLLAARDGGHDWSGHLRTGDIALVPSACHSVYPVLTGRLPRDGEWIDVSGHCFRREPSPDPARMQSFRMREIVRVGSDRAAVAHRDSWVARAAGLLTGLGLTVREAPATDPFFGRTGRMLGANQATENLKTELLVPMYGEGAPAVAVASGNYHRDHFGKHFDITTVDGTPAHSACLGFGIERIALALLAAHGLDRASWPDDVAVQL